MVPKELVLEVLNDHLENCDPGAPLILDGFPRTTAQLAASDDGRVPITIERAVWLDVPRTIAEARLRQRAGSTPRNDDGDRAMAGRFAVMNETVEAVRHEFAARGILEVVDASRPLPFRAETFDAVVSNDAMCHIRDRLGVLRDWHRVLKPGGRALFTDAMVLTVDRPLWSRCETRNPTSGVGLRCREPSGYQPDWSSTLVGSTQERLTPAVPEVPAARR